MRRSASSISTSTSPSTSGPTSTWAKLVWRREEESKAAAGIHPPPINHVKRIYAPFSDEELSARIAQLVTPAELAGKVEVVYQTVAGLRWAITSSTGDWYFTGDYPTPGGFRVVNRAFINYIEKRQGRAYEAARA